MNEQTFLHWLNDGTLWQNMHILFVYIFVLCVIIIASIAIIIFFTSQKKKKTLLQMFHTECSNSLSVLVFMRCFFTSSSNFGEIIIVSMREREREIESIAYVLRLQSQISYSQSNEKIESFANIHNFFVAAND